MASPEKVLYTAHSTATGGRDGRASSSDGVLNVRGIRIGPAEIYRALAAGVPEVAEAMAVEQVVASEIGGTRLVLLVVLRPEASAASPEQKSKLWQRIRDTDRPLVQQAAEAYAKSRLALDNKAKDPERFFADDWWRDWLEPAEANGQPSAYRTLVPKNGSPRQ